MCAVFFFFFSLLLQTNNIKGKTAKCNYLACSTKEKRTWFSHRLERKWRWINVVKESFFTFIRRVRAHCGVLGVTIWKKRKFSSCWRWLCLKNDIEKLNKKNCSIFQCTINVIQYCSWKRKDFDNQDTTELASNNGYHQIEQPWTNLFDFRISNRAFFFINISPWQLHTCSGAQIFNPLPVTLFPNQLKLCNTNVFTAATSYRYLQGKASIVLEQECKIKLLHLA